MSNAEPNPKLVEDERERLQTLWEKAAQPVNAPPEQATAEALAFGVNFRIHLGEALIAAWETSRAVVQGVAAAHVPFAWWAWTEVAAEAVGAVHAIFSSLVQRMRPIDYITAVILSVHPEGLTTAELRRSVEDFLNDPQASKFAWHFGMNESLVKRATEVLSAPDWLSEVLKQLARVGFLEQLGDRFKFKSRNYEIGWKAT